MIVFYCDRCGKRLSTSCGDDVLMDISNMAIINRSFIEKTIHLCGECFKSFIDEFMFDQKEDKDGKSSDHGVLR